MSVSKEKTEDYSLSVSYEDNITIYKYGRDILKIED